jgi:hypothetical protein
VWSPQARSTPEDVPCITSPMSPTARLDVDGRHRRPSDARPTLLTSTQEAIRMLNGDVARYRTQDLVRAGEAHRASRAIAARRQAARGTRVRRVITTAVAMLPIPVKH